jgi:pyrimidine-nucleoside phosphorylase
MRAVDIIINKRDKKELTREEINFFISGFAVGDIPDYQASAFAMAVFLNGMTHQETADLTLEIVDSGQTIDLKDTLSLVVDKHSTGGVGDKTTLAVGPMVAACGIPVGKMSGRGLGFSGGTLDKIESIPGFRTDLSIEEFKVQLKDTGLVLTGQTAELAPADGKLYSLRDVTGTVQSIPLIASSVMSKKIAAGAQAIVLDVKVGSGAFTQTLDEGHALAQLMVDIARLAGRKAVAFLSDMNQPLGYAIGNSLEVVESIRTLRGEGPPDFVEHCCALAARMLMLGRLADDIAEARIKVEQSIVDGTALEHFRQLVAAQNGDVSYVDNLALFPQPAYIENVYPTQDGFFKWIDAKVIGETAVTLGAGRAVKSDVIDHAVGIVVHKKVGDVASIDDPVFTIYSNHKEMIAPTIERLRSSLQYSETRVSSLPYFHGIYDEEGLFHPDAS